MKRMEENEVSGLIQLSEGVYERNTNSISLSDID